MNEPNKVAVVIYEPLPGNTSKVYRGLKTALEFTSAGDDVVVVFDGSGVETLAAISDPASPMHPLATALRDNVHGACSFCASSHKVKDQLVAAGWPLLAETNGEASIRNLVAAGRQILTF